MISQYVDTYLIEFLKNLVALVCAFDWLIFDGIDLVARPK